MSGASTKRTLGILLGVVCLVGVAGVVVSFLGFVTITQGTDCKVARHEPLSIERLIDVKQRFESYRASPEGQFEVSSQELAMLIEDDAVPMFVEFDGNYLRGAIAIDAFGGGCWPVAFEGIAKVEGGVGTFEPNSIQIGGLELSALFGTTLTFTAEDMPSARVGRMLQQTQHAEVKSNILAIDFVSPETFSWK